MIKQYKHHRDIAAAQGTLPSLGIRVATCMYTLSSEVKDDNVYIWYNDEFWEDYLTNARSECCPVCVSLDPMSLLAVLAI